jgi:hypothetical protein
MNSSDTDSMERRLTEWLATEGYPLEFATAKAFRNTGFRVFQGYYTASEDDKPAREIDVVATMDSPRRDFLLRVVNVVECKWSGDKPWVFFCSDNAAMTSAAIIAHAIASQLGDALMWKDAGSKLLGKLELFQSPKSPAFGGRQGFSGSRDVLFDALRSVTGAARSIAEEYDAADGTGAGTALPPNGIVAIPLIVVTGRLFEVRQGASGDLELSEVPHTRIHWRGANQKSTITTVDVVNSDYLEEFCKRQATDIKKLLEVMSSSTDELMQSIAAGSLDDLKVIPAARGVVGRPQLLNRLHASLGQALAGVTLRVILLKRGSQYSCV